MEKRILNWTWGMQKLANYKTNFYKLDFTCNNSPFGIITSAKYDYNGIVRSTKLKMLPVNNKQRFLRRPISNLVSLVLG